VSKRFRRLHVDDGLDLLWVALDSSFRDEVAQQLASRHPEGAFLRVELDVVAVEVGEGFLQVVEQAICFRGLDDDIVDVDFNVVADLFLQARLHAPLIGGSRVFEPEGHHHITIHPVRGDERHLVFILDLQPYLVVPGVRVEE
jgi:hypothetical protein